jgi:hypothetical protein
LERRRRRRRRRRKKPGGKMGADVGGVAVRRSIGVEMSPCLRGM